MNLEPNINFDNQVCSASKYSIGDRVFLKTDKNREWPMTITNFDTDGKRCTYYYTRWINNIGNPIQGGFPEESLMR